MASNPMVAEVVRELEGLGYATYKNTMLNHGAREPIFGVKIEDMKKILKRTGMSRALAVGLWDTGIYDAMYMAGLAADADEMTAADMQKWVKEAYCPGLSEYPVPWVAAESPHATALATKWIESEKANIASSGWATWASMCSVMPDEQLDKKQLAKLLKRVESQIHDAPNRVRYVMNGFVIAVGCYVPDLNAAAKAAGKRIGLVDVDVGDTSCKIPNALEYIAKVEKRGAVGKKRKTARC